ncbi:MAG: Gmad2 immunoglobulin-like domain-containing protein [Pseudomonadota bacterium]
MTSPQKIIVALIVAMVLFSCARTHTAGRLNGPAADPMNAGYTVEGEAIRLIDGFREVQAAPGSATKIITAVFGSPVYGDIDGDGDPDAAMFLTHDPGGSGTFYYVAVALNVNGDYHGTNAVLLGDRVAPQTVGIRNGVVVADYADRGPGEPMAASPSAAKSMYLILESGQLTETKPLDKEDQVLDGKSELIYLESPLPGARVASPLEIRGRARGFWFFDGDFPIVLTDANGKVIAKHFCIAKGEWMTREFVRFEGSVEFEKPGSGEKGTLILLKDNPTGLPDFDDALVIPVFFK